MKRLSQIVLAVLSAWYCGWTLPTKNGASFDWFFPVTLAVVFGFAAARVVKSATPEARVQTGFQIGLACLFAWSLSVTMHPVFESAKIAATKAQCISNIKRLALAGIMYQNDYDDRYPPANTWRSTITKQVRDEELVQIRCRDAETPWTYAMNRSLSGLKLDDVSAPAETVFVFESNSPICDSAGGRPICSPSLWARVAGVLRRPHLGQGSE